MNCELSSTFFKRENTHQKYIGLQVFGVEFLQMHTKFCIRIVIKFCGSFDIFCFKKILIIN
jgi:hypothetical protein